MNIPLDKLYHFIELKATQAYGDSVIIYRFYPHGSKNINDLNPLRTSSSHWIDNKINPLLWCNDQEPLNYDYYEQNLRCKSGEWVDILRDLDLWKDPQNLDYNHSMFAKSLLLHSEQRSPEVDKYRATQRLIPVYYWSHAVIARDWFRYAEHEDFSKTQIRKTFLIYNRAWGGSRQYRLRFMDLLTDQVRLISQCKTNFNPVDPESQMHYSEFQLQRSTWRPRKVLENYFSPTQALASNSGDFVTEDYQSTEIEVVLETLFDDARLHLTEKSLRPIACGQPFVLAGTTGSLQYLKSYGFKTFESCWDETYDRISDPDLRLQAIIHTMREIANWTVEEKQEKLAQAQQIARYNQQRFFSGDFFNAVCDELSHNLIKAFEELKHCDNFKELIDSLNQAEQDPRARNFIDTNQDLGWPTRDCVDQLMQCVKNKHSYLCES